MESGFGDYNIAICIQKHVISMFKIQDGTQMRNKMGKL